MMRLSAILLVCLLKHALSVPLVEFYEIDATTTSTLGADEDAQCSINVDVFFLCGDRFNGLCVSSPCFNIAIANYSYCATLG